MHVLNERLDLLLHDPFAGSVIPGTQARHFVARQRLAQHLHQRAVARQEHRVSRRLAAFLRGHVEADQRLACTGYAGDEHDGLSASLTGEVDDLFDAVGCDAEIARASIVARDTVHGMMSVEGLCRLDDRRGRLIRRAGPREGIDRGSSHSCQAQPQRLAQRLCVAGHRSEYEVIGRIEERRLVVIGLRGHKDRQNRRGVAGQVKVLQVERVVPCLIEVMGIELSLAHLELDDEHGRSGDEHRVDPAADSRDVELEEHAPLDAGDAPS